MLFFQLEFILSFTTGFWIFILGHLQVDSVASSSVVKIYKDSYWRLAKCTLHLPLQFGPQNTSKQKMSLKLFTKKNCKKAKIPESQWREAGNRRQKLFLPEIMNKARKNNRNSVLFENLKEELYWVFGAAIALLENDTLRWFESLSFTLCNS